LRVTVLYFAAVRDLVGRDEERLELAPSVRDVGAFRAFIGRARPELDGRLEQVRIARNEVFVLDEEQLAEGDVLALIPPVAGG
jgi:molybdopterin converting factor subunit 1